MSEQLYLYLGIVIDCLTEITTHPSSTTVSVLQVVTLTCSASVDDVTYSWHRVSGSISSRSRGRYSKTLTIPRAGVSDSGIYYCMVTKEGISIQSNEARVKVTNGKDS